MTKRVAVSLDDGLYESVERARKETNESRSEFYRRALELRLRQRALRERVAAYAAGYERVPEGCEEVEAARRAASRLLAEEPW